MAMVFLPTMLREATGGEEPVEAQGATVEEVIADLELRWPGIRERLMDGDRLRGNLSVAVDGEVSPLGVLAAVGVASEVYFLAAIRGGRRM